MIVVIPHQDDQLKLIKIQKELITLFNSNENIFLEKLPLWINIDDLFTNFKLENLKSLKDIIKNIKLSHLEWKNDHFVFEVIISTNQGCYKTVFPIAYKLHINNEEIFKVKLKTEDFFCLANKSINLKIFRVGNTISISDNSIGITDSVWVKLKA